jgi:hypothetical protein
VLPFGVIVERLAYVLLATAALWWILGPEEGASFRFMMITGSAGIVLLVIKVIIERLTNTEDKHYSKTIEK